MIVADVDGDRHGRLRAGGPDREHGEAERQQRRGDAPPPARSGRAGPSRTSAIEVTRTTARRRRRRVHHQTANTSGMTRRASSAHGQEKDIQITRPDRMTVSTAPAASSARARAMNAPASGSGWLVTVSRRLIGRGDPVELARVRCGMVRAAGGLRDRLEGVLRRARCTDGSRRPRRSSRPWCRPRRCRCARRPSAMRPPRVGRGLGAGGAACVLAVGEQHDRGRGPVADVRRAAVAADGDRLAA